jgi:hypothetical protein
MLPNSVVWWLSHCIAKLYEQQQQFKTDQGQGFGLRIFSVKIPPRIFSVNIPRPHNSSGSSKIIFSTRPSWSSG